MTCLFIYSVVAGYLASSHASHPRTISVEPIKDKVGVHTSVGFTTKVKNLWNTLPVFRDNKYKVPVLHVPNDKKLIRSALGDTDFRVATKTKATDYFYK